MEAIVYLDKPETELEGLYCAYGYLSFIQSFEYDGVTKRELQALESRITELQVQVDAPDPARAIEYWCMFDGQPLREHRHPTAPDRLFHCELCQRYYWEEQDEVLGTHLTPVQQSELEELGLVDEAESEEPE